MFLLRSLILTGCVIVISTETRNTFNDAKFSLCDGNLCACIEKTSDSTFLPMIFIDCSIRKLTTLELNITLPPMTIIADFSRNNIEHLREAAIFRSFTLKEVDFSRNQISFISGIYFRNLPKLSRLNLSRNKISDVSSTLFVGISNLFELNLSYNLFQMLPNKVFLDLKDLQFLSLSSNPFGDSLCNDTRLFDKDGLGLTTGLKVLRLENLKLTRFPPTELSDVFQIREVYLSDNPLTEIPELPHSVEVLDMSGTNLHTISPKQLHYPRLKQLFINRAYNLTQIENYAFYHLDRIEVISLENCIHLSFFNDMAFGVHKLSLDNQHHSLRKLSLARSGFTNLNISFFPFFSRTQVIQLEGNPWHCDCHLDWIKEVNIDINSPHLRCDSPAEVQAVPIKSLPPQTCYVEEAISWVKILIVLLLVSLLLLGAALVVMGPYDDNLTQVVGGVGPTSPYNRITIEPNLAENVIIN